MTITSRYQSRCRVCGGQIQPGEQIEWSRGEGSRHVTCPEQISEATAAEQIPADAIHLGCGSGYGGRPYTVGSVIPNSRRNVEAGGPAYVVVLAASQRYIRDDGMLYGVGDDDGYCYSATCRAATDDEARPLVEAIERAQQRKQAVIDLRALTEQIETTGERPEDAGVPEGEEVEIPGSGDRLYGSGAWLVLGAEYIWYVRNNGMDGDNWAYNNVRTGGAGAIGWRVPATPELVAEICQLITTITARD